MCVFVCKLFSFVKDFSRTTAPRILKFGTNVGYDLLHYTPVYEVYRGYVVFVFSVTMFVCVFVCKLFFIYFVKDFSGTTESRILKFGTNVGYKLLYCVRENQPPPAYRSLYLLIFLSLQ